MPSITGFPKQLGTPGKLAGGGGAAFANIKVIGIPQAILALTGKAAYAKLQLGLINKGMADHMANLAQDYCPVVTGNLRSSIKVVKSGPAYDWTVSASSLEGSVAEKNWYEYAGFVENGTSNMEGRFFMQRAYNETLPLANAELAILAARIEA